MEKSAIPFLLEPHACESHFQRLTHHDIGLLAADSKINCSSSRMRPIIPGSANGSIVFRATRRAGNR